MAPRPARRDQRDLVDEVARRLPGSVLTHPFGDDVDVHKVGASAASDGRHAGGKMFCVVGGRDDPGLAMVTLKVDPDHGVELVRDHPAVSPGYHTDKRHWVTVVLDGSVDDELLASLVEDSYELVVATLTARARFDVDPDRFPLPPSRSPRR